MRELTMAVALIVLSSCGGERSPAAQEQPNAEQAGGGPVGWNAMDACATVGKDAVTNATGKAVTATSLDSKSEPDGPKAGFSMCTFTLAGGAKMTVLTREATSGDDYDAAVAAARKLGEELGSPAVDVPGLGKAALWTAAPPSLQVFIDDRRYATISMFGANFLPDASDEARAAATAVARKLTR
jgi:hypothetical protein